MAQRSSIEWTDATWNPTRGCTKIAPGCKNCYAETFAERFRGVKGHAYERGFDPRMVPEKLSEPLRTKKPTMFFVNSMSDLFHEGFPFEYIDAVFASMILSQALGRGHTFQILTKRTARMGEYMRSRGSGFTRGDEPIVNAAYRHFGDDMSCHVANSIERVLGDGRNAGWPPRNVWLGCSIANQDDAGKNVPILLQVPAVVRFLSVEPLIGPVYLGWLVRDLVNWVIVGGESGPGARPCNVEWVRSIVQQCKAAGVPVFVKQLGAKPFLTLMDFNDQQRIAREWSCKWRTNRGVAEPLLKDSKGGDPSEWPADLRVREFPDVAA